ncbi:MAG: ABC transporter substrate-binding protein [bacterium]
MNIPVCLQAKYKIGVSLPLSGSLEETGQSMLHAMKLKVEEINKQGGINGQKLSLVVKDDKNTPDGAKKVAGQFANNDDVLGVVGHYYSSTALGAQEVYDTQKLVNIAPVANNPNVSRGSPWTFGMLPPTSREGNFMAVYLKNVLDVSKVHVIAETGTYGSGLKQAFLNKAREIDLNSGRVIDFNPDNFKPADIISRIRGEQADAIVVLSQVNDGKKIIRQFRTTRGFFELTSNTVPIMAPSAFSEAPELAKQNRKYEGKLFTTAPFLYQIANQKASRFQKRYKNRYGKEPGTGAAMAHDAIHLIAEAIRRKGPDRSKIRDYLATVGDTRTLTSVTGQLQMDPHGAIDRDLYVVRASDGRFKVAFNQIERVRQGEKKSTGSREVRFSSAGQPYRLIDVVYVGIGQFRIQDIEPSKFSYDLELFMWFKWKGDRVNTDRIIAINGVYGIDDLNYVLKENVKRGINYRVYRKKSSYLTKFDLRDFPFDRQQLSLTVAHKFQNSNRVMLVPDVGYMSDRPMEMYDPEWEYEGEQRFSELYQYPTTFGDPSIEPGKENLKGDYFSSVNVNVIVDRKIVPYILSMMLPITIILAITLVVGWYRKAEFSTRITSAMSALLSLLVFHMTQSSNLPNVGYLTKADLFFITAYIWIFLLLVKLLAIHYMVDEEEPGRVRLLNHVTSFAILVGMVLSYGFIVFR